MTGIILAGGKNSRIGITKAFLKIDNKTIIESLVAKLQKVFEEIIIVTNSDKDYQHLGIKMVKDTIAGKGSLGGIYSGLINSKSELNFVVACDMPFLNIQLVKYMINNTEDFDIVIPRLNDRSLPSKGYETLHAIYSKKCLEHIEKQMVQDNLKIINFFPGVGASHFIETSEEQILNPYMATNFEKSGAIMLKEISEEIIKQFDPQLLSFININTDVDYQRASKIASTCHS